MGLFFVCAWLLVFWLSCSYVFQLTLLPMVDTTNLFDLYQLMNFNTDAVPANTSSETETENGNQIRRTASLLPPTRKELFSTSPYFHSGDLTAILKHVISVTGLIFDQSGSAKSVHPSFIANSSLLRVLLEHDHISSSNSSHQAALVSDENDPQSMLAVNIISQQLQRGSNWPPTTVSRGGEEEQVSNLTEQYLEAETNEDYMRLGNLIYGDSIVIANFMRHCWSLSSSSSSAADSRYSNTRWRETDRINRRGGHHRSKNGGFGHAQSRTQMVARTGAEQLSDFLKMRDPLFDSYFDNNSSSSSSRAKLIVRRTPVTRSRWTHLMVAGLYNTGTNSLYNFFKMNCGRRKSPNSNRMNGGGPDTFIGHWQRIHFQVPWRKHNLVTPLKLRNNATALANKLAIVVIKDPLTWLKSFCKARYYMFPMDKQWYRHECPRNLRKARVVWHHKGYENVLMLWNKWYSAYLDLSIPSPAAPTTKGPKGKRRRQREKAWLPMIMVRFEDLLFKPKLLNDLICGECVRGDTGENMSKKTRRRKKKAAVSARTKQMGQNVKAVVSSDQSGLLFMEASVKYHGSSRNRSQALKTYANPEYRLEGFSKVDLRLARMMLNHTLLEMFGYMF